MRSSAIIVVVLALAACADLRRGEVVADAGAPGASLDGGEAAPSFAADVHGALMTSCAGCHSAAGQASTTGFLLSGDVDADYQAALGLIDDDEPEQSRLVTKGSGSGHGGGAVWPRGSAEHDLLLGWIRAGAPP